MAAAAQKAPERTPYKAASANESKKKETGGSMLHRLPRWAGIAIMAALLVAALFVGNFRALQRATPEAFVSRREVKAIMQDRLAAANNAMTVARRAGLEEAMFDSVNNAVSDMEAAEYAWEVGMANQALTTAVSEAVAAAADKLDEENRAMLQSAADDFAEQGSFLRQEARAFNEEAEAAMAVYDKLPTRFLLEEPDYYLGL